MGVLLDDRQPKIGTVIVLGAATTVMAVILLIVIYMNLLSALAPELITALESVEGTGLPLSTLFSPAGIIAILVVIGIMLGAVYIATRNTRRQ